MKLPAARSVAHPNIALAKYWGKTDGGHNLPAVPSLSVTLDALSTTTTVGFGPSLSADRISIQGEPASPPVAERIRVMLDRVREAAGIRMHAWVETANDFATASGLASSASGFAALAMAATRAAGLSWESAALSDLARRSSASAARSIFGGFAALPAGQTGATFLAAEQVATEEHWPDLAVVVAMTTLAQKSVGSTDGMAHTKMTSPFYGSWVASAPAVFARTKDAVMRRDIEALGVAAEESALAMHACALAAAPALLYWNPLTLTVLYRVREMRKAGLVAYATIDAGPHVKVLTTANDAPKVEGALREIPGIQRIVVARPGAAASVMSVGPGS